MNCSGKGFLKHLLMIVFAFVVITGRINNILAAAAYRKIIGTATLSTGAGLDQLILVNVPFATGSTLEYSVAATVTADIAAVNILAIDTHNIDNTAQNLSITQNATIGSIVDLGAAGDALAPNATAKKMNIKYAAARTVTLTGTNDGAVGFFTGAAHADISNNYSALATVDFASFAGTLNVNDGQTIFGTVNSTVATAGTLSFVNAGAVNGAIGVANRLTLVQATGGGAVTLGSTVNATTITVAAGSLTTTGLATATTAFNFTGAGTYNSDGGITGNVNFAGNAGTVNLANGKTITGTINSTVAPNGTLNFNGAGTVTGAIGATNNLALIKTTGAGLVTLSSTAKANAVQVANAGANLTTTGLLTAPLSFTAGGTYTSGGGITGNIDFAGNAGTVTLATTKVITGTVDSTVATGGTLIFNGAGTVTGAIGATNNLTLIKTTGAGLVTLSSTAKANAVQVANAGANLTTTGLLTAPLSFTAGGTYTSGGGITGNIDFAGNAGTVTLATSKTITGAVDSTVATGGTLTFGGVGTVTGAIGATNNLTLIRAAGAGAVTLGSGNAVRATTIQVSNSGAAITATGAVTGNVAFTAAGTYNSGGNLTGNVDFANNAGTVNVAAGQTITGAVNNTGSNVRGTLSFADSGTVTGAIGATRALTLVRAMGAGAVTLGSTVRATTITVAAGSLTSTGLATAAFNFTGAGTYNSDGGITGNVNFVGNAGTVNLANGKTITGTVNSTVAPNGTLNFNGAGTVTGAIGATNNLALIKTTGAGLVTLSSTAKANAVQVANAGANLTTTGLLTAPLSFTAGGTYTSNGGITGNIDFAGNAGTVTLAASKTITGAVDSTVATGGTLTFGGVGTVTSAIGATNPLALIQANGAGAVNLGNGNAVRATTIQVANAGAIVTAAGAVTGNVAYSAAGTYNSNGGLTGNVDFAGNTGIFNVATGQTITGSVDSTVATAGTLRFNGGGTVSGNIGVINPLALIHATSSGAVNLGNGNAVNATTIQVANASAVVTAAGAVTGNLSFTAAGTYNASGNLTGNVNFTGNAGTVNVADGVTITGAVDNTGGVIAGRLIFAGSGTVTGNVGATKGLTAVQAAGAGNVLLGGTATETAIQVSNAGAIVTVTNLTTGAVNFTAAGTYNSNGGLTGNVNFAGNAGTVNVANGQTITGVVDSTVSSNGILHFNGGGVVTGNIGATNNLALVEAGAGNVALQGTVKANAITVTTGNLTTTGLTTGSLSLTVGGTYTSNGGLTGNATFAGNGGTVNVANGQTITGAVVNTGLVPAGTLHFNGAGTVTGDIGATNALASVEAGAGNVALQGTVSALGITLGTGSLTTTGLATAALSFTGAGTYNSNGGITGNIDFASFAGTVNVASGQTITGAVDSTVAANGTLHFNNNGTVTGDIGSTNALALVEAGAGSVALQGTVSALGITLSTGNLTTTGLTTAALSFTGTGTYNSDGGITGSVDFAGNAGTVNVANGQIISGTADSTVAANGTLHFNNNGTVTGDIGSTNALALVEVGAGNVALQGAVKANSITLSTGNLTTTGLTTAPLSFTAAGTYNSNGGIAGNIDFAGNAGTVNVANARIITGTVDSTVSSNGILHFNGGGTVTGNIGATNTLALIEVGAGSVALEGTLSALGITLGTGNLTTTGLTTGSLSLTAGGTYTSNGGITGNIDFAGNAGTVTLAASKTITGAVDSTVATGGTLTFGGVGTVTSVIGATNPLALIQANGAGAVNLGNGNAVRATTIQVANAGAIVTAAGAVTGNVAYSAAGTYNSNGGLTGNVDFAGNGGIFNVATGQTITGSVDSTVATAGTLRFNGGGVVTGNIGVINHINMVTVAGNGTTLQLGGNVGVSSINGTINGADTQNLKFINAGNIEVAGDVGNIKPFSIIEFSGLGQVNFSTNNGLTTGDSLHFSDNTKVITNGYSLGSANITSTVIGGELMVNTNQTITGNIENFGKLSLDGNIIVDLNTADFGAAITTENSGDGVVNFILPAGITVRYIGAVAKRLGEVNFIENGSVEEVHADSISIENGAEAAFTGGSDSIDTNSISFAAGAVANFGAQNLTASLISSGGTGNGIANFKGTNIGADVGAAGLLDRVNFESGQTSVISANIRANEIEVGAGTIHLATAVTFESSPNSINFNATRIELGENDLTVVGGNLVLGDGSVITTTVNGTKLGSLIAGAGSNITNGNLNIEVDDLLATPVDGQVVKLIEKKDGGTLNLNGNKITVIKNGGAFAKWVSKVTDDGLILTNQSQVVQVITNAISSEVAQIFGNVEPGTQGEQVVNIFNRFINPDGSPDMEAIEEGISRLMDNTANEVIEDNIKSVDTVTNTLNERLFGVISLPVFTPQATQVANSVPMVDDQISGISAGDEDANYGVWGTPFYSKNIQRKRENFSSYRSSGYGGTFGFDTKANEQTIVGLAFTAMNTEIKYRDFKSGDNTKINTFLLSAYTNYQFDNNWFGQGVFSVGSSDVINKENRMISTTRLAIAQGKYNFITFAADVLGGYNHVVNNQFVITPMVGLGYNRTSNSSYQETGDAVGPQLLYVTRKAAQKLDLVAGLRVTALPFMLGEVSVIPEVHGSIRYDVIGRTTRVSSIIPGLRLPNQAVGLQRTYNVGASVKTGYGMMDYGLVVDTVFAKKYFGVNGFIDVRVNF